MVEAPGQFAIRGGLMDIYPSTRPRPTRIELFGDEVESLREFDLESQRSTPRGAGADGDRAARQR